MLTGRNISRVGAAVGGAIAGVAVIAAIVFAVLRARRRANQRARIRDLDMAANIAPFGLNGAQRAEESSTLPFTHSSAVLTEPPTQSSISVPNSTQASLPFPPSSRSVSSAISVEQPSSKLREATLAIPLPRGADATGSRLTDEQVDFVHGLYSHNVPVPAIARVLERFTRSEGGDRVSVNDPGSVSPDSMAPPSYDAGHSGP